MKKSLAITIFCLLGAVILGLGAYAWRLDSGLERSGRAVSAYGSAAMGEFAGALSRLDGNLRAAGYAADGALRSTLCAGAAAEAASAVTALSSLPYSTQELETLAHYINGAGDLALCLSREAAEGRPLSHSEREALGRVSDAVRDISADTGGIFAALDAGELELDEYGAYGVEGTSGTVGTALAELDAALESFPELDYDGAYAHLDASPALLEGLDEVSEGAARLTAARFLGLEPAALESAGQTGGALACYVFEHDGGRISVTKRGGVVLAANGECPEGEGRLGADEARRAGEEFIASRLEGEFTLIELTEAAGGFKLVFVPLENGVLLLPDRVSLTVGAAAGEVCEYDAADYVMRHCERGGLVPALSREEAAAAVNPELSVEAARLALLSSDGGDETLCWEFNCLDGAGERVYVFVDAKMGREVKIELA